MGKGCRSSLRSSSGRPWASRSHPVALGWTRRRANAAPTKTAAIPHFCGANQPRRSAQFGLGSCWAFSSSPSAFPFLPRAPAFDLMLRVAPSRTTRQSPGPFAAPRARGAARAYATRRAAARVRARSPTPFRIAPRSGIFLSFCGHSFVSRRAALPCEGLRHLRAGNLPLGPSVPGRSSGPTLHAPSPRCSRRWARRSGAVRRPSRQRPFWRSSMAVGARCGRRRSRGRCPHSARASSAARPAPAAPVVPSRPRWKRPKLARARAGELRRGPAPETKPLLRLLPRKPRTSPWMRARGVCARWARSLTKAPPRVGVTEGACVERGKPTGTSERGL